jgi:hypothetical protein
VGNTTATGFLIDDDSGGNLRSINVPLVLRAYTVASMPACNAITRGGTAYVTDAVNPTYLGAVRGGGPVTVRVLCSGTSWVAD